ncbi:hypothetical protein HWV62_34243 [Athelia sp. TMB]|nr:hypothetical protein HWV62_34243 [Athelia sp. TMB]
MVLKLYGSPVSGSTKRVAMVLDEKHVSYEFHIVDLQKGAQKAPEHVAKQPFGQVPYIDDDGFILYESRAIARYIATKYASQGTPLIPLGNLRALALFEQAAAVEQAHFEGPAQGIRFEHVAKKMIGLKTDEARVAELTNTLASKLDVYEGILSKQKYVAGDELTLADLFHLPCGVTVKQFAPELFASRPHVAKWFESIENRQSWQAIKDVIPSST